MNFLPLFVTFLYCLIICSSTAYWKKNCSHLFNITKLSVVKINQFSNCSLLWKTSERPYWTHVYFSYWRWCVNCRSAVYFSGMHCIDMSIFNKISWVLTAQTHSERHSWPKNSKGKQAKQTSSGRRNRHNWNTCLRLWLRPCCQSSTLSDFERVLSGRLHKEIRQIYLQCP